MGINAFTQLGNTVSFIAATTAPTPVQAASRTLGGNQYRIINNGSVTVFLGYGVDASTATAGANTAPDGTVVNCLPLLPNTDEILTFQPNAYFTGKTATGSATIYISAGDGL